MIAITIILSLSAVFIMGLITFWKDIVQWIKKAVDRIKEVLGVQVQGTRTFIKKTTEGFKNISKYYSENKLTGEWEENILTKTVSESEIPAEILAKVNKSKIENEISTTEELELALS